MNRQFPPRILVDYDYRPARKSVAHVATEHEEGGDDEWEDEGEWQDDAYDEDEPKAS